MQDFEIIRLLIQGGGTAFLLWVIFALMRGDLVPKGTHMRVLRERDRLFEIAMNSTRAAEGAVTMVEQQKRDMLSEEHNS